MSSLLPSAPRIAIIGLGYVGLPLAVAFGRHFQVLGYDVDERRIAELREGRDRTGEIDRAALTEPSVAFSADPAALTDCDVYILTVPTPIDGRNRPDLSVLQGACRTVGAALAASAADRAPLVVVESTVYPGVTETVCGRILSETSGRQAGTGFHLGYSPERINPGDREHGLARIVKVVAGNTSEVSEALSALYGRITNAGIFVARDIMTAEAAKAIENAQRDVNIAFVNEVAMIVSRLGLSAYDVLDAARTKWNFIDFTPGLVGGHCIGVDPNYLAHLAKEMGHRPEAILAGRRINDGMGQFIAGRIAHELADGGIADNPCAGARPARILVLGLTFKENVPDLRNTKVLDVIGGLESYGHTVDVHDPVADPEEARARYGIKLLARPCNGYDCVVGAVAHDAYAAMTPEELAALLVPGGLLADIKGQWRTMTLPDSVRRWQL